MAIDSLDWSIRSEEHGLLIRREHRIRVFIAPRKRQHQWLLPIAIFQVRFKKDVQIVRRSRLFEVERLAITSDCASQLVVLSGDHTWAYHFGLRSRFRRQYHRLAEPGADQHCNPRRDL